MKDHQKKYLLHYLRDLEKRIDAKREQLQSVASYNGISVGSVATTAAELTMLQTEQRTICFTLGELGYYVVYDDDSHVQDIVLDEE